MYEKSKLSGVHFGLEIVDDQGIYGTLVNNAHFLFYYKCLSTLVGCDYSNLKEAIHFKGFFI